MKKLILLTLLLSACGNNPTYKKDVLETSNPTESLKTYASDYDDAMVLDEAGNMMKENQ